MRTSPALPWPAALLLLALATPSAASAVHHAIQVSIDPDAHRLAVHDSISLPAGAADTLIFRLHAGLSPRVAGDGAKLTPLGPPAGDGNTLPLETYRVDLEPGARHFSLRYGGEIHHPVAQHGEEYARSFAASPGLIGPDGVFLGGASHWYPRIVGAPYLSYELAVSLPAGWHSVSQGYRTQGASANGRVAEIWREASPQEEIYLVAARFKEYQRPGAQANALVFLREPDEALAERYLELTGRYLQMYEELIGPYPYGKFALVENFWETGYGMPSFTLLGPKVIRLPFIPYTSYPHEILHNWWGNGVYVDFASGNWSEGLTSYLADHLLKAQRGQGPEYRRSALQKYADYVGEHKDFPLSEFRGRHSSVTEAVGYGKTLMVFHMLRGLLGDEAFIEGLRRFYRENSFRRASWADLARAFDAVSDEPLDSFFDQWTGRPGAPELRLRGARVEPAGSGYRLTAAIDQTQDGPVYRLRVPVAVQVEGREEALVREVVVDDRTGPIELELPARPLRLAVDPAFDVFRRLHRGEIPPAISQALGGDRVLIVLPSAAPPPLLEAYEGLARAWQRGRGAQVRIRRDEELAGIPDDRVVWLLGWENRFRPVLDEALAGYAFESGADSLTLAGEPLRRSEHAAVVLARHPANPDRALGWVGADNAAAIPGLARKLPHYGKYSYLGFTGDEPENALKGQWPVTRSPLSVVLTDGAVPRLRLPERKPLAELPPAFSAQRMMEHVRRLADPALEGRGLGSPGLEAAAEYIARQFREAGLEPAGDPVGDYYRSWEARSGGPEREMRLHNLVGVIPGTRPELSSQSLVVGAHYDHLGRGWPDARAGNSGKMHPGADDNASGIAVLLELARVLADGPPPERTIVFVAFTGEEAGRRGSRRYVADAGAYPAGEAIAMLNLDTVGRLGDGPLYALGAESAREWPHILKGAGHAAGVQVEPVTEPLDASDQVSFIEAGIPAVQLFGGAHADYHRPSDTADRVDADGLVRVAAVARETIDYLAGRDGPLTATDGDGRPSGTGGGAKAARRAALGTVPDFAYSGEGVRLSGVNQDSPAQAAGLREGDVVIALNGRPVGTLGEYADVLRALDPGDPVEIRFLRGGESRTARAHAVER